ncbi:MAG: DUF881 domain-containing protein, partial [Phycicoccus sp.]
TSESGTRPQRPDASMTLLTTMMSRPLDPGYAAMASRREAAGLPRSTSLRAPRLVVATLVIGLVVGASAASLTAASSGRTNSADLVRQIEERRSEADALSESATRLESEVARLESALLGDSAGAARARELAVAAGTVELAGPGVRLTLDDAPGTDADAGDGRDTENANGRVLAKDLQYVVNTLWQAGAEAVSVNGHRLTSLSAIRFAGPAIIVDSRPLNRPYVLTALGDPDRFPDSFADGPGGSYVSTLQSTFGIRVDSKFGRSLRVPAVGGLTTRYAAPGDTGPASPSPSPTTTRGGAPGRPTSSPTNPPPADAEPGGQRP